MPIRALWVALPGALCLLASVAAPAAARQAATCGTRALESGPSQKSGLRVVSLDATGVSCARAVTVARGVAKELGAGKPLALTGSAGLSMTQTTPCGTCPTATRVTLTLARGGTVTIGLKGRVKSSSAGAEPFPAMPGIPSFPGVPSLPTPGSSGGGPVV